MPTQTSIARAVNAASVGMQSENFGFSSARLRRVKKLQFGIVNPHELRQYSVTQAMTLNCKKIPAGITRYEIEINGHPVYGGANDPRLGSIHEKSNPGHFGHIDLAKPVYHQGFFNVMVKVLHCVCYYCSRLRMDEIEFKFQKARVIRIRKRRLEAMYSLLKGKRKCDHCNAELPKYTKVGLHLEVQFPDSMEVFPGCGDKKQFLPAAKVVEIFKRMREEDIKSVGLDVTWARPEWLLVSVLPVPPIHVRPSVVIFGGALSREDDLTHQIVNIVKSNIALKNSITHGEPNIIVEQFEQSLQHNVAAFMDNELRGLPQVSHHTGRPLKTLQQRLKGKDGRIRGNLLGKHMNFSARTVITADPNLGIEQVGVPRSVAMNLTVPERVTPFNISQLSQLIANGPLVYPGAKHIIRSDGMRIDLRYVKNKAELLLVNGWIVERHLRDDDIVLFNRQPSLHKMSIMGHRVKVLDWSTFRLNLSCTSPYNADFDGDEMNLHVPQSLSARTEAEELMLSSRMVVSSQSNRPVMGIVQDSLLAVQKMTKRDVFMERDLFFNILMWIDDWDGRIPPPAIMKPKELWTGKQVMTMILPRINLKGSANNCPPKDLSGKSLPNTFNAYDDRVTVRDGELVEGTIDKKTIGSGMGGLIHTAWLDVGFEANARFMNQTQKVVNYWVLQSSFSIGVIDTIADFNAMQQIENTINKAKSQVRDLVLQGQRGELEIKPGRTIIESFEQYVNKVLNTARDHAGMAAQESLTERNSVKAMVLAGSKGSFINISQIIACVGQQNVEGKRIPCGFKRRSLPHFLKDDLGSESRGFVENSYLKGLNPQEFFFHAMGGREGLIDTACKTAETGYIQRRLVKAMETVMSRYDGTIRNSGGNVVQFLYGEDGMDATYIERQKFELLTFPRKEFQEKYELCVSDEDFGIDPVTGFHFMEPDIIDDCKNNFEVQFLLDREIEILKEDQATLRMIMGNREAGRESDPMSYAPGNIQRVIMNATQQFRIDRNQPSDLHPKDIIEKIKKLLQKLVVVHGLDTLSMEAQKNATTMYEILIRSTLATKRVLLEFRLSEVSLDWILGEIEVKFQRAKVNPGEMAGVLAAQSIGEPTTQMTLNTFHYAGVSEKNVTLGVPRLKEILNVSECPRTPSMTVYLQDNVSRDQDIAKLVHSMLEYTILGDIAILTEIHYDPNIRNSVVLKDKEFVKDYYEMSNESEADLLRLSRYVLRIELDHVMCYDKKIQMNAIVREIESVYGQDLNAIASDDNAEDLVVRVRIVNDVINSLSNDDEGSIGSTEDKSLLEEDWILLKRLEKDMLRHLKLCGVEDVKNVSMQGGVQRVVWNGETGFDVKDEWVLYTEGSNFMPILACDFVDATRTITNDIVEVFMVLGIEGVRCGLLNEIRKVISFDGSYVNYRHLACLVDFMTMHGYPISVDKHGFDITESGVLLQCSFEDTVAVLLDAAVFAREEKLKGVTENIMMGEVGYLGTGCFDLLLDEPKVNRDAVKLVVEDSLRGIDNDEPPTPYTSPIVIGNDEFVCSPVHRSFCPSYFPVLQENYGSGLNGSPLLSLSVKDVKSQAGFTPSDPAGGRDGNLLLSSPAKDVKRQAGYTLSDPAVPPKKKSHTLLMPYYRGNISEHSTYSHVYDDNWDRAYSRKK